MEKLPKEGCESDFPLKSNMDKSDVAEAEVTCGLGNWRPGCLQKLATMSVFTGTMCVPVLLTSTLSTYVVSQVTTLEKQFGLSSSQSGLLMASNDIGYVTVAICVSYFAPRVHIPRFLAFCTILFGASGIICSLPHFLFGARSLDDIQSDNSSTIKNTVIGQMCSDENQSELCEVDGGGANNPRDHASTAVLIIILGMILQGAAKAPRHPFLVTYIDDNVVRTNTGFFLGVFITVGIMGPVVSFSLGGLFTKMYVTLEETNLHPRHPKWVGAWWLGYIVFGVASLISAFPIFFFPRKLIGAPKTVSLMATNVKQKVTHVIAKDIKTYFRLLSEILINPIYMCLLASTITLLFAVGGMQSFLPKYIENQFGLVAWKANLIMAGLSLSTACVGTFVGGLMSRKFKMGPLLALKWNCALYLLVVIFFGLGFIFGCDQPDILNTPGSSTEDECMSSCNCNKNEFFPICGDDNRNYFSPCHAGCSDEESGIYTNCTCIPGGSATAGSCHYSCPYLVPYFLALGVSFFASTLSIVPKILTEIRCVTEEQKPLSIGVQTVMASLLGWMLSPVIFGRIIDTSCLIWDDSCGNSGACVLYDLADFRVKLHGLVLASRAAAFLFALFALLIALKTKVLHPKQNTKDKDSGVGMSLLDG